MRTGLKIIVATGVLLFLAGAAGATSVDYLQLKYVDVDPGQTAKISTNSGHGWSNYISCGQYNLKLNSNASTYSGTLATSLIASASGDGYVIGAYCIDINQTAPSSYTTYNVSTLADAPIGNGDQPMGATKAFQLEELCSFWSPTFTDNQAAAFDAAVWEIINESGTTSYDLDTGTFRVKEKSGSWGDQADTWLGYVLSGVDASGHPIVPDMSVMALTSSCSQDYAICIPSAGGEPPPAPEPVTLAGLFMGIGGLATYLRKRRLA